MPREIEIWFTELDGCFYVIAEYASSQWLQNIRAHSAVQVKVAGAEFPAKGRMLFPESEPDLVNAVQNLSRDKYGWGDGVVVQLRRADG